MSRFKRNSPDKTTLVLELEATRHLLSEQLRAYLERLPRLLRDDMVRTLEVEGKLLHQPAAELDGRWALLPFHLAHALQPEISSVCACGVGLAMECVVCATDLLDDAMDGDVTPLMQRLGMPRVLNTALALMTLAQSMLSSLAAQGISVTVLLRLQESFQRALLLATAGQQQDLLAEEREICSMQREECLEIARNKAGALFSLACQLGAQCAGVAEQCQANCAEMGQFLGLAAQLDNDAHDLYRLLVPVNEALPSMGQKSDLTRRKKTLPMIVAAQSLRMEGDLEEQSLDAAFLHLDALSATEREICLRALQEGIITTWGIALLYRERGGECLTAMEGKGSDWRVVRYILDLTEAI